MFRFQAGYLKASVLYERLGAAHSLVRIVDPHKPKIYRTVINLLFSKLAVDKLAPVIQDTVEHAADVIRQRHEKGEHVEIRKLYGCITVCT